MNVESKRQKNVYLGYIICILLSGLTIWAFFPGLMSPDSIGNLTDGRSGNFHDINSPLMSYLWGNFDKIISGPALMLIFQTLFFFGGCAIFWQETHQKSKILGLSLILFAVLPHIWAQIPVIWKDIGLGAGLFLSTALFYKADKSKSKIAFFLAIPFVFYASAARLNAFPAVLPITIWGGFIFCRIFEIGKSKMQKAVFGIVFFTIISISAYSVNNFLTEGKTVYPSQQIYLYDLAAISKVVNKPIFPEYILNNENFSFEIVKDRYNERSVSGLIFPNVPNTGDVPPLKLTINESEIVELKTKWLKTVTENPLPYLKHRGRVFFQLIGISHSVTRPYWDLGFNANPPEYKGKENIFHEFLMKYFAVFSRPFTQTFFFRAIIWLLIGGYLIYQAKRHKFSDDWEIVFVLSLSCILFTFAYFPTTPSTEFRYLFWSSISSAVAIIFGINLLSQTPDNFIGKILSRFGK